MKADKYRWVILAAGSVLLLFLGLIYAWSIFRVPLEEMFPEWTTAQTSMTFTISMVFFCCGAFLAGQLLKRMDHKPVLILCAVLIFLGFFGVSLVEREAPFRSLAMLYLLYGVVGGCGVGIGYNTVLSTVNRWFSDRAGLASGIMMMGFGLGGIVLGSMVDVMMNRLGLQGTFRILACVIAVVVFAGALIMKTKRMEPAEQEETAAISSGGLPPSRMVRQKSFWCLFIWAVLMASSGLIVINNAASIALAFGAPAVVGMVVSICNGFGRVLIGALFDRYRRKAAMFVNVCFTFSSGLLLLTGDYLSAGTVIIIGLLFTGMGYGGNPTLCSAFIYDQYGAQHYPVNFSICNFSLIPAAIIGPMISSFLIDKADGAYTLTFVMIIVLALGAFLMWGLVNRFSRSEKEGRGKRSVL